MKLSLLWILILIVLGFSSGAFLVSLMDRLRKKRKAASIKNQVRQTMAKARSEAVRTQKNARIQARNFEARARKNVEEEIQRKKNKLNNMEKQLRQQIKITEIESKNKQEELEESFTKLQEQEEQLNQRENHLNELENTKKEQIEELRQKLEQVSSLTAEQVRENMESLLLQDVQKRVRKKSIQLEKDIMTEVKEKAKIALCASLARYAGEYVSEKTVSVLSLPNDEMKGRIIGREGRNIRALESICGVDLIVDETPEAVVISSFDPVRREVARRSLLQLMEDGRVHPARIEEVVTKVRNELTNGLKEEGEKACLELGITHVHKEILRLLGSLKYKSVHMQNALTASIELGAVAGLLASEVNFSPRPAKRAGLLHAIGLALDHTFEGGYAQAGADFMSRHGENKEITSAIRGHEGKDDPKTVLGYILQVAHTLVTSRPGARRPKMNTYVQRLKDLESIGNSFEGVERSIALQGGKEVRVLVEGSKITDEQSIMLGKDIAKKIEKEMSYYPGQIRISVIRETKAIEYARG